MVKRFLPFVFMFAVAGSLALQGCGNLSGIRRIPKDDFAAQQCRNEDAHRLSEDMAERQQTHKAHGVKPTLQPAPFIDFPLEPIEVRQKIPMCQTHAFGLRSRAGRKNDFGEIVVSDRGRVVRVLRTAPDGFTEFFDGEFNGAAFKLSALEVSAEYELCRHLLLDARGKFG